MKHRKTATKTSSAPSMKASMTPTRASKSDPTVRAMKAVSATVEWPLERGSVSTATSAPTKTPDTTSWSRVWADA